MFLTKVVDIVVVVFVNVFVKADNFAVDVVVIVVVVNVVVVALLVIGHVIFSCGNKLKGIY